MARRNNREENATTEIRPCVYCGVLVATDSLIDGNYCTYRCAIAARKEATFSVTLDTPVTLPDIQDSNSLTNDFPMNAPDLPDMTVLAQDNLSFSKAENNTIEETMLDENEDEENDGWRDSGERYDLLTKILVSKQAQKEGTRSIILGGNGASLNVKGDSLVVTNGLSYYPQEKAQEILYRAVHNVDRIIWCAASGNMSFAALKWMDEQNIAFLSLDKSGQAIASTIHPGYGDIALKRKQYGLSDTQLAVVARWLILEKIRGQYAVYKKYGSRSPRANDAFSTALSWLEMEPPPEWLQTVTMVRAYEARTAALYFMSLKDFPLKWYWPREKCPYPVPTHWRTLGSRKSPIGGAGTQSQHAVTPGNAVLNYAYGVLEHTARYALLAAGFDISVGIVHADYLYRDSLIYDLMEIGRGAVDILVCQFLRNTTFSRDDFIIVKPSGEIRLHPELARFVAATCVLPANALENAAKELKQRIMEVKD